MFSFFTRSWLSLRKHHFIQFHQLRIIIKFTFILISQLIFHFFSLFFAVKKNENENDMQKKKERFEYRENVDGQFNEIRMNLVRIVIIASENS